MSFGIMEVLLICLALMSIGLILTLLRLFLGPTAPDRVVALDTMNTIVVCLMVGLGAYYLEVVLIDIAIVYALLSFVSTLFIARYMERTKEKEVE